jgi:hypothetical protein
MKCDDARAAFLAGEATSRHLDHLRSCQACSPLVPELESTFRLLEDAATWEDPAPELEDRVVTLVSGGEGSATRKPGRPSRRLWTAAAALIAIAATGATWGALRNPGPDWEVALPGTPEAAAAVGSVKGWNETGGTRLIFDIEGLAPAPRGSVYEVWFSRDTLHVSAGTFTATGSLEMWAGVARRDYPRIWITLEPLDGNESPSGVTVMDTG